MNAGPSSDVETPMLRDFRNARMSSLRKDRFVATTNSTSFCDAAARRFASSVMSLMSSILSSGSPPWNSILRYRDGDRNTQLSAARADSDVMSYFDRFMLTRDTWQ